MKQQEILKKIGNILKELNEQYEYLQAEQAHINDLELELFAANAKFLTDHNEILRKINAQQQNIIPALPEHHEPEEFHFGNTQQEEASPLEENTLPPFSESALNYQADAINTEPEQDETVNEEYQEQQHFSYQEPAVETEQPKLFGYEEPATPTPEPEQPAYEEPTQPEYTHYTEPEPEQPAYEEPAHEEFTHYTEPEPEQHHEHNINIEPAHERDSFDFTHHEPQVSEEQHTFELQSSYTEEESPAPPHIDLTAEPEELATETQEEQPEHTPETYESILAKYGQPAVDTSPVEPEYVAPVTTHEAEPTFTHEAYEPVKHEETSTEPEPATPEAEPTETFAEREVVAPAEEEKPVFTHEAYQPPVEEPKTFQTYTPPVEPETPKPEPEQPLSLHERLAAQLRGESAPAAQPTQHQQQPAVTDIKSAINMNDRLLFVKDLFNGYGMAYNEAIELLNRCKNFEEADKFLKMNYVTKNHWEEKPNTVDKFYAVLRRRFSL